MSVFALPGLMAGVIIQRQKTGSAKVTAFVLHQMIVHAKNTKNRPPKMKRGSHFAQQAQARHYVRIIERHFIRMDTNLNIVVALVNLNGVHCAIRCTPFRQHWRL